MSRYFELTRKHTYSLLFALPLLVAYEVGALMISGNAAGMRNGADVLLRTLLAAGGLHGTLALTGVLVVASAALIVRERRRHKVPIEGRYFGGMLLESAVYALLFGVVVGSATSWV